MLKGDRQIDSSELGYFMSTVATRGVIVSVSTASSGTALDSVDSVVAVPASSSGALPIGMLLDDVVNLDLTRTQINWHKHQQQVGGKVSIMTKGWVVTDCIVSATAGQQAVLVSSGCLAAIATPHNAVANPIVGRFRSDEDEDGFARVYIDL